MDNITPAQLALLEQLRAVDPDIRVRWNETRGAATSIRGRLARLSNSTPHDFLRIYGQLFGLPDPVQSLKLLRERTDDLGWKHIEFQQIQRARLNWWQTKTLEVYGARLAAHIQPDGTLIEVQSSCWPGIRLETSKRVSAYKLRRILHRAVAGHPDFARLERATRQQERNRFRKAVARPGWRILSILIDALWRLLRPDRFPITLAPQLVIYPWGGSFRIVWEAYAYTAAEKATRPGKARTPSRIEFGQVFVDASTREIFLFAPSRRDAETPDTGTGLGVTPLSGPFASRSLNIVRVDGGATYRLRDTIHAREIITYDCGNDPFWTDWEIKYGIHNSTLPISQDTEGDKNWNRLPADVTEAERAAGQQPEVDAHFYCREVYEWYDALAGGRAGWDDNQYTNPPVPQQPVRVLVHRQQGDAMDMNAYADFETVDGQFYYWLVFGEGIPGATCSTPGDRGRSYMVGAKTVVAHEYQHAITDFSFTSSLGRPGLNFLTGWFQAVHEGLSDTFGCLFAEHWQQGSEVSPTGLAFRNLAFPRDPNTLHNLPWTGSFCGSGGSAKDHFADRDTDIQSGYDRGTILAHCAYLMGEGGVHQRSVRTPALIPVQGMGREAIGGKDVLKAARIWYRALTWYYSTHGIATERPEDNEVEFRELRDACESAAIDLYGDGSLEHRTTALAFYAVGLHPADESYGADATFLRWGWGWSWRLSRPYLGGSLGTCPNWSSPDLFINNGGISEWNALINVNTPTGPTDFENMLYCRVRNVGDQAAEEVQVQFEYAKAGTASTVWLPVADKDGNIQALNLGTLGAGQSNFSDGAQNSPPASAGVKWYIPPLEAGETVNHFCLRATVSSSNDVNQHNNVVQSNIAYVPYASSKAFNLIFTVGNPTREPIPVELVIETSLPEGWGFEIEADFENIRLDPGEERKLPIVINMLPGADKGFTPPFDGAIQGEVFGSICGPFEGTLSETSWDGKRLLGRLTAVIPELGTFLGTFNTRLDLNTGEIKGRASGKWQCHAGHRTDEWVCVGVQGYLRPLRRIDMSQLIRGERIGGVTLQVQVPVPGNPYAKPLPPTDTHVTLE